MINKKLPEYKEAERLIKKFQPHAKNWDCYHDQPLEENHARDCALIMARGMLKMAKDYNMAIVEWYWLSVISILKKWK